MPQVSFARPAESDATILFHDAERKEGIAGVLAVIEGDPDDKFFVFPVRHGDNVIGRDRHGAQVRIVERSVSHIHARITCEGGAFLIEALQQQRNPTYLNGQAISVSPLVDGDTIRMGRVALRFRTI